MIQSSKSYNARIQDSENLIQKDEPVFLLRGQDQFSVLVLSLWLNLAKSNQVSKETINEVETHLELIKKWQLKHKTKLPDLPKPLQGKYRVKLIECPDLSYPIWTCEIMRGELDFKKVDFSFVTLKMINYENQEYEINGTLKPNDVLLITKIIN